MRLVLLIISLIVLNILPAHAQNSTQSAPVVSTGSEAEIDALIARARNEEAGAQEAIGNRYETGTGVQQDYVEAAEWYRKAADQGVTKAQKELGNLYAKGLGVPRDYEEAYFWLSLSTDPLSAGPNPDLAEVEAYLRPDQRAEVQRRLGEWKPSKKHGSAIANAVEHRVVQESCAAKDASIALRIPHRPTRQCKEAYGFMKSSCGESASCVECKQAMDSFTDTCGHQEEADPAYACSGNADCGLVDTDCNAPYEPVAVNRQFMSKERKLNSWPAEGCPRTTQERQMFRAVCTSNQECGVVSGDDTGN